MIEGLACFAEFDVFPGDGNLRADPLSWLASIAKPQERFGMAGTAVVPEDELIKSIVYEMRNLESTARRKDTLLAQQLDPTRRGGYHPATSP